MTIRPRGAGFRLALAAAALAVFAPPVGATLVKCQRTIIKAGSQFVQAKAKALAKCEGAVVKGTIPGPCPDASATTAIATAGAKLAAALGKSCGGADHVCGGDRSGEDTPTSLGWPATCPNFEHGSCTNTIGDCGGIATCIACVGEAAVDQAAALYYDALALPSSGALNACQIAIGKASVAFLGAESKALQKCWDARLKGKHGDPCVPPAVGDGKYQAAIAKAEAKKVAAICKACGGPDETCGTMDDLDPVTIGFPTDCPALTAPSGPACGGPITGLPSLVACVDCVTGFKAECVDRLQVSGLTPYPSACNVCTLPAASGPCPTTLEFTADGPAVDLDTGFKGLSHDAKVPTNGRLTLAISGCSGANQPTCGQCAVAGPLDNAGGVSFDDQRCSDAPWITCGNDGDCIGAGATGPCAFFFGAPLPLVAGGVATCVVNEIAGPVTGTVDLDDGSSSTNVPLRSAVYIGGGGTVSHPCPVCTGGVCSIGLRMSQPCTVQGTGEFGDVSLDCPPAPGASVGTLEISLAIATGTQTRTLSTTNPRCTESAPFSSLRCQCDTCNNVGQEACASNADCPMSGGNPGICGGKRCLGGGNAGAPCTLTSECPGGGNCNRPGEATKPNDCADDTTTPFDGLLCQDAGHDEGECLEGPVTLTCSVETFRSCSADAECNPPPVGTCANCILGQTCQAVRRACFLDNGVVGTPVNVVGAADVPCGGVSYPVVGSFFCVGPVGSSAVNSSAGLPGLGRIRIPGKVVVTP